jgi:hypothetical protein
VKGGGEQQLPGGINSMNLKNSLCDIQSNG